MTATQTVRLRFGVDAQDAETHTNLSAVRAEGDCLWVAGDETATVERLVADSAKSSGSYGQQRSFALADYVDLPGPSGDEADIEGIGRTGGFLWAVGSHSLKRKKIKASQADAKAIKQLAKVEDEPNRRIVVRIPVVTDEDGLPALAREVVIDGVTRTAAVLGGVGESLTDLLADDVHLGPFLDIPSKDNGFDLEGVAAVQDRLYLGLRGPVLRGWAVVIEVHPYVDDEDPHVLRLREIGPDAEPYRKHFLDLDGLGVRDLCPDGDDLLVLSGPSMDLDGPVRIYRWHDAARTVTPEVVRGDEISRIMDLRYGEGDDHPEGLCRLDDVDGRTRLLVVYDSPAAHRIDGDGILADVVSLG
ncbi:MAG TPA: DUF3616 domain-containing protein [Nocardioidaceae bacterium]|nr:DUF3616 domain-containing protein [Nocardioidaceae bacterium]